jgi:hypothetical protein
MSDDNVQEIPVATENKVEVARELREQVELRMGPPNKTVIAFAYCYDTSVKKKRRVYYDFIALWIAETGQWYCTGRGGGVPRESSHEDFMKVLGSHNVKSASVLSGAIPFKP